MKFLPKSNHITYTQVYSRMPTLEAYIDQTKTELDEKLPLIFNQTTSNLNKHTRYALTKLKKQRTEITVKPADKNLGIVILDTDDYIQQCSLVLCDQSTYRLTQQHQLKIYNINYRKRPENFQHN